MTPFWFYAERADVVVGLATSLPIAWTWWRVTYGERRRQRKWHREVTKQPGDRPGALVIDFKQGIVTNVKHYLVKAADPNLRNIPENRFLVIHHHKALTLDNIQDFALKVQGQVALLRQAGVDTIHLFYAGPIGGALIVGAELSNGPRVLVYQFEQGGYVPFGPLEPLRHGHRAWEP